MRFNKSNLPINNDMLNFWNENGYLIIENFKTEEECDSLIQRSKELIEEQDFLNQKSVFDTVSQSHNDDSYFLESGDKIRFFFEEKAVLNDENIKSNKQYIVNKIGHALHDLDDSFIQFSKNHDLDKIAKAIDARMGEVYWAVYDNGSISNIRICKPENVDNLGTGFVGVGSVWKIHNDELTRTSKINHTDSNIYPESTDLIDLSLLAIESGQKATFDLPQPIYLRNNVAQKSLK